MLLNTVELKFEVADTLLSRLLRSKVSALPVMFSELLATLVSWTLAAVPLPSLP